MDTTNGKWELMTTMETICNDRLLFYHKFLSMAGYINHFPVFKIFFHPRDNDHGRLSWAGELLENMRGTSFVYYAMVSTHRRRLCSTVLLALLLQKDATYLLGKKNAEKKLYDIFA